MSWEVCVLQLGLYSAPSKFLNIYTEIKLACNLQPKEATLPLIENMCVAFI
jgi:hypothetical protein